MPLEQVKTQVLILHGHQATLDDLSACVDDRFTVHCATSGSEALSTLGQTPIHVLITAQDLPGMSGIEALREARKRSPETIGILLATDRDANLEALVGVDEVFQIVHGGITRADLNQLIDDAAQQVRLLTLGESANDSAVGPQEPETETETEHIVIETADNGSTIVSDGSGTWSVHRPETAAADGASAADEVEILVVSKDEEFIATIQKSSLGVRNIRYANTPAEADEAFAKFPIGVAVIDAAMVGSKVEDLTRHLRMRNERLVCIVAGRRDDGEMLMDLINRGKVYRFLLKPISPGRARLAIEASVRHHVEAPKSAFQMTGSFEAALGKPGDGSGPAAEPVAEAPPPAAAMPHSSAEGAEPAEPGLRDTIGPAAPAARDDHRTDAAQTAGDEPGNARGAGAKRKTPGGLPIWLAAGIVITSAAIAVGILTFTDTPGPGTPPVSVRESPAAGTGPAEARSNPFPVVDGRVQTLLGEAESAVIEKRLDDAAEAVSAARRIDPDNARLPFLTAQIDEMRLRRSIDVARLAIRESRFADAATALQAAGALDPSDRSEIDAVTERLLAAQSEQRTEDLLERAAASMDQDRLLEPQNDSAAYYYELVLQNDPRNSVARQGLAMIAGKLVLEARDLLDEEQFDRVEYLLEQARRLDPSSGEIEASASALGDARQRVADRERRQRESRAAAELAAAEKVAAEKAAAEEAEAEAERQAAAARGKSAGVATTVAAAASPEDAGSGPARDPATVGAPDSAATGRMAGGEPATVPDSPAAGLSRESTGDEVATPDSSAREAQPGEGVVTVPQVAADELPEAAGAAEIPEDPTAAAPNSGDTLASAGTAAQPDPPPMVSVSSLTRVRYVAPKYPRSAARRNLSGWVDIVFTVTAEGKTRDIEIRDATPGDVFVESAARAVEKWEFEPVLEDGTPIERRAGIRMMFAME